MHSFSPEELVRQADALADIERNDRTNAIIEALQEYLEERRQDEQFWEHVAEPTTRIESSSTLWGRWRNQAGPDLSVSQSLPRIRAAGPDCTDESADIYDGETASVDPED